MALIDEIRTLVTYYGAPMTDGQIDLYIDGLADLNAVNLHAGIVELIKTSKWMPKVSEIRQAAEEAQERIFDGKVLALHDILNTRRLATPWMRQPWGCKTDGETAVIVWNTCSHGHQYANWDKCPECNEDVI